MLKDLHKRGAIPLPVPNLRVQCSLRNNIKYYMADNVSLKRNYSTTSSAE